tara:strand:+ start:39 stop:554 length:516 start_codon:yes stop_codon:yes gene_type:complete
MKTTTTQIFFLSFIILLLFSFSLFAHSGRTNSAGCHNVTKTGGYHCHNGGTPSTDNNKNDSKEDIKTENIEPIVEIEGTFLTQFSDLVVKNFRCETNWKVDIVNRSTSPYVVYITFYTLDKDGDPLLSVQFDSKIYSNRGRKINELSRQTFNLKSFDCSIKYDEIKFLIKK